MIPLTKEEIKSHKHATKCHICLRKYRDGDKKVEIIAITPGDTEGLLIHLAIRNIRYPSTFQSYFTT